MCSKVFSNCSKSFYIISFFCLNVRLNLQTGGCNCTGASRWWAHTVRGMNKQSSLQHEGK